MQIPKMFSLAVRRFMLQIDLNNKFDCTQTVSVCVCVCVFGGGMSILCLSLSSSEVQAEVSSTICEAVITLPFYRTARRQRAGPGVLCASLYSETSERTQRGTPRTRAHTHTYIYTQNESELRLLNKRHISVVFTEDSSTHDSGESTGVHYKMNEG